MGRYVTETSAAKGGCYGYMRVLGHILNGTNVAYREFSTMYFKRI